MPWIDYQSKIFLLSSQVDTPRGRITCEFPLGSHHPSQPLIAQGPEVCRECDIRATLVLTWGLCGRNVIGIRYLGVSTKESLTRGFAGG